MNLATLQTVARRKRASQSELARLSGVSRQAVSKWFRSGQGEVQIRSTHLKALAGGLGVRADLLLSDLPGLASADREQLRAALLWDRAYPDLDALLVALVDEDPRALGRLVESFGLYRAAAVLGDAVWDRFPEYRRFVHPARRRGLEQLWQWRTAHTPSDVVVDANLFRVGAGVDAGGVSVAPLETLLMCKAATLVSRCSEKDLYDLWWIRSQGTPLDPAELVRLGSQIDAGAEAESILISLMGAEPSAQACDFALPDGPTVATIHRRIMGLKKDLQAAFAEYLEHQSPPPLARSLRHLKRIK